MSKRCYKIYFLKKSATLNKEDARKFVIDILRHFGGLSLLSAASVTSRPDATIEISSMDDTVSDLVHCAVALCGSYQELKCRIQEVERSG